MFSVLELTSICACFLLGAVGCVLEPLVETILGQIFQVTAVVVTKKMKKNLKGQNGIFIVICTTIIVIKLILIPLS